MMTSDDRNRAFEEIFVGGYQRSMTHFYSIGILGDHEERFAYGYFTPDDFFHQGITLWNVRLGKFTHTVSTHG